MLNSQAILISLIVGGAFGALATAWVFARQGRSIANGAGIGAIAGAVGAQISMVPLQHCVFEMGEEGLTAIFFVGVLLAIIGGLFLLVPLWLWAGRGQQVTVASSGSAERFGTSILPYLFLIPTILILIPFLYWPMVRVIDLSLQRSLLGLNARFVCLDNYASLANDPRYLQSFGVTFFITGAIIIIGLSISLFVANLANQNIRGANIYRTLLIWPYALSPLVTGIIFTTMFNPIAGPVNFFLNELFGIRPQWFSDATLAPWVVILASIWNNMGFNILFYIAGLQSIPNDLLEAAEIDGASKWQRFLRIKFPLLSPYTFFLLVTNLTYGFYNIFGAVDGLTQGGPRGATEVLIYKLYRDAFEFQKTGNASAQSLILFLLVAGVTIIQFRYVDRRVTYGG